MHQNDVVCFKSFLAIHRLLLEGPPQAIKDSNHRMGDIDVLARQYRTGMEKGNKKEMKSHNLFEGYSAIVGKFGELLLGKIAFHSEFTTFPGNLDVGAFQQSNKSIAPKTMYVVSKGSVVWAKFES